MPCGGRLDYSVIFQGKSSDITVFRACVFVRPSVVSHVTVSSAPRARAPRFLIRRERKDFSWWGSLKTLCTPVRLHPFKNSIDLFRSTPVARFRFAGGAFSVSLFLHLAGSMVLAYLPWVIPPREMPLETASPQPERIQYRLIKLDLSEKLPPIAPAGPGGRPGLGSPASRLPAVGSTSHSSITVVSRPVLPDNLRQTIYQSLSPPDLRITVDLKLPNVVLGMPAIVPRPQIHFNPNDSKPTPSSEHLEAEPAPSDILTHVATSVLSLAELSVLQAHLVLPPAASTNGTGIAAKGEELPTSAGGVTATREASGILVVGTDASDASSLLALPLGNRWGEFMTGPVGGQSGSLAGSAGASVGMGHGGGGAGGDSSIGLGHDGVGGGGGGSGFPGVLSISRTHGKGRNSDSLEPNLAADMVYPVPSSPLPRRNALVVSAGPMGGGGLNTYGILHCGKIYTVFLEMPGKGWALQYCRSPNSMPQSAAEVRRNVVVLELALQPPEAESKFDFRRLPVPEEKKHKRIVLKGMITEEGTVENLQVYQGILPQMDEAARIAFSRWKFKPALRGGNPVAVEILIGIPSDAPQASSPN